MTRTGHIPDSTEADCHSSHCGCAEKIQGRVGTLRTGHLFLHGLLQHLCTKKVFSIKNNFIQIDGAVTQIHYIPLLSCRFYLPLHGVR